MIKAGKKAFQAIAWMDPKTLHPHPKNFRRHPAEQVAAVGTLIEKYGWLLPLLVNKNSGYLLNGHARRQYAIESGSQVPVMEVELDERQEEEILASLDKTGEMAVPDDEALLNLLQGFGEALPIGWEPKELEDLLLTVNARNDLAFLEGGEEEGESDEDNETRETAVDTRDWVKVTFLMPADDRTTVLSALNVLKERDNLPTLSAALLAAIDICAGEL